MWECVCEKLRLYLLRPFIMGFHGVFNGHVYLWDIYAKRVLFTMKKSHFIFWADTHQDPLQWRHNDHDGVWNHQPHGCLLNRLFRRRLKKTSRLRVTGLCVGNSPGPVNSPHKGPVTRKMFPFDDVIMISLFLARMLTPRKQNSHCLITVTSIIVPHL